MDPIQVGDTVAGPNGIGQVTAIRNGLKPDGFRLLATVSIDGSPVDVWLDQLSHA